MTEINISNNPVQTTQVLSLTNKLGVIPYEDKGDQGNKAKENYSEYKLAYPNTIVANSMNVIIGSVGISKYFGCVSPVYYVFSAKNGANLSYLNYIFQTEGFQKELRKYANGILEIRLRVSVSNILKRKVPFPGTDEQCRVATFLDAKCAEIDALSADIQAQIDTLEAYKRSVITKAVTKGLNREVEMKDSGVSWIGNIPKTYTTSRIKYEIFPLNRAVREDDDVITCFRDGEVTLRKNRREDGFTISFTEHGYQGVAIGDLVIHGMDAFAGAIGCSDSRGKTTPVVHVCKTSGENRYFMYFLRSMAYNNVFMDFSSGIRVRSSDFRNFSKLGELPIIVPPIKDQRIIIQYIDVKCAKIDAIIAAKKEQLTTLADYKKSLIYEYVTGKKEVPVTSVSECVAIDPHIILAGIAIERLGESLHGKIEIQKVLYLFDYFLGISSNTQYYRYKHGPYDLKLDSYLDALVSNKWFDRIPGKAYLYVKGSNFEEFHTHYETLFSKYEGKIERLIHFITPMKRTSQVERAATLFAVWNDLLIDGNTAPTDAEIIAEARTNWTPNKAHSTEETWQGTLDKMKKNGIIPKGIGLHTLPMPERGSIHE
jgi:type I restriction enzyme S subunit